MWKEKSITTQFKTKCALFAAAAHQGIQKKCWKSSNVPDPNPAARVNRRLEIENRTELQQTIPSLYCCLHAPALPREAFFARSDLTFSNRNLLLPSPWLPSMQEVLCADADGCRRPLLPLLRLLAFPIKNPDLNWMLPCRMYMADGNNNCVALIVLRTSKGCYRTQQYTTWTNLVQNLLTVLSYLDHVFVNGEKIACVYVRT